jgi:hypothetical protein
MYLFVGGQSHKRELLFQALRQYVVILEAVKEVKFIYYLLHDIGIEVKLPIIVKADNVGAMFMAQNSSSGVRTRHVDIRYHFVRENLDGGIIKIEFIKSVENQSDIFTKNVTQEIYERHVETFLEEYIEGEFNG